MGVKFPGKKRYVTLEWPLSESQHGIISNRPTSMALLALIEELQKLVIIIIINVPYMYS